MATAVPDNDDPPPAPRRSPTGAVCRVVPPLPTGSADDDGAAVQNYDPSNSKVFGIQMMAGEGRGVERQQQIGGAAGGGGKEQEQACKQEGVEQCRQYDALAPPTTKIIVGYRNLISAATEAQNGNAIMIWHEFPTMGHAIRWKLAVTDPSWRSLFSPRYLPMTPRPSEVLNRSYPDRKRPKMTEEQRQRAKEMEEAVASASRKPRRSKDPTPLPNPEDMEGTAALWAAAAAANAPWTKPNTKRVAAGGDEHGDGASNRGADNSASASSKKERAPGGAAAAKAPRSSAASTEEAAALDRETKEA